MGHADIESKHEKSLYRLAMSIGSSDKLHSLCHDFLDELSFYTDAVDAAIHLQPSQQITRHLKCHTFTWPISKATSLLNINVLQSLDALLKDSNSTKITAHHPTFSFLISKTQKINCIYLWKLSTLGFLRVSFSEETNLHPDVLIELEQIIKRFSNVLALCLSSKAKEGRISKREKLLEDIVNTYPQPIIAIDQNHKVIVWNNACEKVFGINAAQVLGTNKQWKTFYPKPRPILADIVLSNNIDQLDEFYPNIYRKSPFIKGAYEAENFFPKIGAHEYNRWLYFTASRLYSDSGEVIGAIESLIDITERMEAESEVRELNKILEQRTSDLEVINSELNTTMLKLANAEKLASLGKLVAGIAHQLSTPIGNIRTISSSLHDETQSFIQSITSGNVTKTALNDFLHSSLQSNQLIEQSTAKAADLISNCKKAAINRNQASRAQFNLADTLEELLALRMDSLNKSNIRLRVEVPVQIRLDSFPAAITQIINYLIDNAIMHGFENYSEGLISLKAKLNGNAVSIVFRDNGYGISPENIAKAFDPFFTAHLQHEGCGLGLYIIYNLVTGILGGTIELESTEGEYTEIRILIPATAPYPVHPHNDDYHI